MPPSSLLSRIASATTAPSTALAAPAPERCVLPLDMVREYLSTHPVVVGNGLSAERVHATLLDLKQRRDGAVAARDAQRDAPPTVPPTCPHCCRGYEVIDPREGQRVCSDCGLVLGERLNIVREWTSPAEPSSRRGKKRGVGEIADWIVRKNAAPSYFDVRDRRSPLWEELQHWNQHVHLTLDELYQADETLKRWKDVGDDEDEEASATRSLTRMASVLLLPRLDGLVGSLNVRNVLEERARRRFDDEYASVRMPSAITTTEPEGRYPCERGCGRMLHTRKDARYHCRAMMKAQRRR